MVINPLATFHGLIKMIEGDNKCVMAEVPSSRALFDEAKQLYVSAEPQRTFLWL